MSSTAMSEREWQSLIVQYATLNRWAVYHTYDSRRSNPGFPDLVLVRVPELVIVECKRERGRITLEQEMWLWALAQCGCEVYVWRPSDWPEVQDRLRVRRNAHATHH